MRDGHAGTTPRTGPRGTPSEPDGAPIHVIPDQVGGWRVEREGAEHLLSQHDSLTAAERAAVRAARVTETPDVVVHDRYHRTHSATPSVDEPGTAPPAPPARKGH